MHTSSKSLIALLPLTATLAFLSLNLSLAVLTSLALASAVFITACLLDARLRFSPERFFPFFIMFCAAQLNPSTGVMSQSWWRQPTWAIAVTAFVGLGTQAVMLRRGLSRPKADKADIAVIAAAVGGIIFYMLAGDGTAVNGDRHIENSVMIAAYASAYFAARPVVDVRWRKVGLVLALLVVVAGISFGIRFEQVRKSLAKAAMLQYKGADKAALTAIDDASGAVYGLGVAGLTSKAHYIKACSFFRLGRIDDAFREASESVRADSGDYEPRKLMGTIYMGHGDLDKAISSYEQALNTDPDSKLYTPLVVAYARSGQWKRGAHLKQYSWFINENTASPGGLGLIGRVFNRWGRYADAERVLLKAVAWKNSQDVVSELARAEAGVGKYGDAMKLYRQAVALESRDISAWGGLEDAYRHEGMSTAADEARSKAISLVDTSPGLDRFRTTGGVWLESGVLRFAGNGSVSGPVRLYRGHYTMRVSATEDPYLGGHPRLTLKVDGAGVGSVSVTSSDLKEYLLGFDVDMTDTVTVSLDYANDGASGKKGGSLYVRNIKFVRGPDGR